MKCERRSLAASNGDSSGDTSFRLSGRSSSSSSSDRSASGKDRHLNVLACTFCLLIFLLKQHGNLKKDRIA